jgi:hypothetical protein
LPPIQSGGCGCWSGRGAACCPWPRSAPDQLDALLGPGALHRADRLVGDVVARVEVGAERLELALQIARRDAEDQAPAREYVERGGRLREQERVAVASTAMFV